MGFSSSGSVKNIIMDSAHVTEIRVSPISNRVFVVMLTEVFTREMFVYIIEDITLLTVL